MATVAKLTQDGELRLSGGINTRLPLITDGLVAHYPMDGTDSRYFPRTFRYLRHWKNGSTANTGNHWYEIKVIDYEGINRALGIIPTSIGSVTNGSILTDGITSTGSYTSIKSGLNYVQLDLGDQYTIKEIGIWDYYNDGRTYHETKAEVSEDGIIWYSIFDSSIEGEYQATSSGKILDLDNLGTTINPITNSNTTLTNDGIAIENATVNYLSSGINGYNAKDINHWTGANTYGVDKATGNQTIIWDSASGAYTYTHDYVLDDDLTTLSGQTVTFSLMLRRKEGSATGQIRIYDDRTGYSFMSVAVDKEFKKFSMTKTIGTSPTRIFVMIDNTGGGTYEFYNCQLEIGSMATEYVDGSRSASGKFTVVNPVKTGEFTISYDWKSNSPVGTSSSYQTSFSMGTYYTNNSFTIMDTNSASTGGAQRLIRKGNAGEWAWIDADLTSPSTFQDWTTITIVRNATYYRVYSNGIYKGQLAHSSATMQDYIHVGSRESWSTGENSSTRNLSIYNRALSDDEVNKLVKGTHSIKADGIISKSIETESNLGGYYFPLSLDGKDYYKDILPSEDSANYSLGTAYVGGNSLEYNLNASIGLDWSGDWSICYMKKPMGTHYGETNLTGYNIESFGCSNNSVGGGYLWFGKRSGSDSLSSSENDAITPASYFNNWQYVTIVKSGTTIIVSTWINDNITRVRTVSLTTTISNYYVTQYGYDFKLGGWNSNGGCYTHFKNLIVTKYAMSNKELEDYRKTKMKSSKDGIKIQNCIIIGEVL